MIYLDHAATSFPKPPQVLAAVQRWFTDVGVGAERGDGPRTGTAATTVLRARTALARMTGTTAPQVAFVSGATEGLNLGLRALLRPSHRVATTAFEHSSVVRPLLALADERALEVLRPPPGAGAAGSEAHLMRAAEHRTADVLVFTHASNVTGACFDAARICAAARAHGVATIVDASQTAGLWPLDVGADVIVASAHKALHGPPGIGFVAVHPGLTLAPQKHGGTGSSAALERHPTEWPQAFEAGTPNTPAIFGLDAALDWLATRGTGQLLHVALGALDRLLDGLREIPGVQVFAADGAGRVPVASFVHERYDPIELGSILAAAGVHVRSGFHCAPWVHAELGTAGAGTVRISPGCDTTDAECDAVLTLLRGL